MESHQSSVHSKTRRLSRRRFVGGLLLMALLPWPAWADKKDVARALKNHIGDRKPIFEGVTLEMTPLTESGNSVPVTITVDSPMTLENHVQALHIFVEGNPVPVAATYHLSPANGVARISTRLRLARTQDVLAVARHSDGRVTAASANITVTLGACADELWGV